MLLFRNSLFDTLPNQKPELHPGLFFLPPACIQLAVNVLFILSHGNLSTSPLLF